MNEASPWRGSGRREAPLNCGSCRAREQEEEEEEEKEAEEEDQKKVCLGAGQVK